MYAWDELAELRRRSDVPIAGAELNAGWQEYKIMLEKGSFDIYQPDATMGGGIGDSKKVMDACAAQGLDFSPHTWTNGIGFLVNLQLYAAGPRKHPLEYPYEPPAWIPEYRDGILAEPIASLPTAPFRCRGPGSRHRPGRGQARPLRGEVLRDHPRGIAAKAIREKGLFTALKLAMKKGK